MHTEILLIKNNFECKCTKFLRSGYYYYYYFFKKENMTQVCTAYEKHFTNQDRHSLQMTRERYSTAQKQIKLYLTEQTLRQKAVKEIRRLNMERLRV